VGVISKCQATKRNGEECRVSAQPNNMYCWAHDPANAEHRRRTASKAGSANRDVEIGAIKRRIRDVAEGVLDGRIDKGRGSVAFQGYGVLIRAIEQERKQRELEEFEERLKALEQSQKGGNRWGA
jgi:hypothetical protein